MDPDIFVVFKVHFGRDGYILLFVNYVPSVGVEGAQHAKSTTVALIKQTKG